MINWLRKRLIKKIYLVKTVLPNNEIDIRGFYYCKAEAQEMAKFLDEVLLWSTNEVIEMTNGTRRTISKYN